MKIKALIAASAVVAGGLALTSCYEDGYYGGVSVGYGSPGYYDYYSGYDGRWGDPYWGWYGDYYYPGSGYYVYDANRRPHRWNGDQQRYWQQRQQGWQGRQHQQMRNNWHDFDRAGGGRGGHRGHR